MTALLPHERVGNAAADLETEFRKVIAARDELHGLCGELIETLKIAQRELNPVIHRVAEHRINATLAKAKGVLSC